MKYFKTLISFTILFLFLISSVNAGIYIHSIDQFKDMNKTENSKVFIEKNRLRVENIGDSESELNWEITETPEWGIWNINPDEGTGLTPEQGKITVNVDVLAPEGQEQTYTGRIKIVNKDTPSDYEILEFTLTTPKNRATGKIFNRLIELCPPLLRLFINRILF